MLSARQVGELYRRRWRSEEAFALTKRLLDLAYWWTGSTHAVQLQLYQHGGSDDLVSFLAEHANLLGLVKRRRQQHRERQELEAIIWGDP